MSTPDELKAIVAGYLPDNRSRTITPQRLRDALGAMIDDSQLLGDPTVIELSRSQEFMDRDGTTNPVTDIVLAYINATPNSSSTYLNFIWPYGVFYCGDLPTGSRRIIHIGAGLNQTVIRPTADYVNSVFDLTGGQCGVVGMTINDDANSWDLPAFDVTAAASDIRAPLWIGRGGTTAPRNSFIYDVAVNNSRNRGVLWDGGSVLKVDRLYIGNAAGGGFQCQATAGDTNHFTFGSITISNCWNFGMDLSDGSTNSGGAGFMPACKFYGNQNYNLRIGNAGVCGSIFVEATNGPAEGITLTRTNGSNVAVASELRGMQFLKLDSQLYASNGSTNATGFGNGTYITGINYTTREVTFNKTASSSGTSNYRSFTHYGNRNPSLWLSSNARDNNITICGDSLDPTCYQDDTPTGANVVVVNDADGNSYTIKNNVLRNRIYVNDRWSGDPNKNLLITALVTYTSGSPVGTLQDATLLNLIRETPYTSSTVSANGALASTSISSINQGTAEITFGANATATGTFLTSFQPSYNAGLNTQIFDNNIVGVTLSGSNQDQIVFNNGRGSRWVGNVTAGSNQLTMYMPLDVGSTETISNNRLLWCLDNRIVPDGTVISSFTGPDANGHYTVTMSQNALVDATGVTFFACNDSYFRKVWGKTRTNASNPDAVAAFLRQREVYATGTGELRQVVPEDQDGRYEYVHDFGSIASGTQSSFTFTTDSNGKAVSGEAIGYFVTASASRTLNGMHFWGEVTATDTITGYMSNLSGSPVDLGSTRFYFAVTANTE